MDTTTKLINILNQFINEYKALKEEYYQQRTTQTLYEELIQTLNEHDIEESKIFIPILLSTIYKDNIYIDEFYNILLQEDKVEQLKKFTDKITKEYSILKNNNKTLKTRIERNFHMFQSAKRIRACLKYQTKISDSKNDIFNIKRIISYYETSGIISNKEELLLINEIEQHNRKVASKRNDEEKDYADSLYNEIPNILTIGFQEHDKIDVSEDKKITLDKFASEIINLINYISADEINELLESYKKYNLDNSEYNYIIVKVLDEYLEELITLYELLIDKDVYANRKERNDVIKSYYLTLEKYINIINYYNKQNELKEDNEETNENEVSEEKEEEKILIYSRSENNITKAKIISDMSYIPYEYYETIDNLITEFKNGTLSKSEQKFLQNNRNFKGYSELKHDQVRIVLKHIKDNIYNIFGVFVKKADNDMSMYRRIMNRMTPDISTEQKLKQQLELSEITEKELEDLVKDKGRKGTR